MRAAALIVLAILPVAASCASPLDAPLSPTFGAAVASLQAHIVAPMDQNDAPPEGSGVRGVAAVRRYERGQPRTAGDYATSNVSTGISGMSSAGAGGAGLDK